MADDYHINRSHLQCDSYYPCS